MYQNEKRKNPEKIEEEKDNIKRKRMHSFEEEGITVQDMESFESVGNQSMDPQQWEQQQAI